MPLPAASKSKEADASVQHYEYSSREVKPAALLLQDLLRAHNIFLLHHDSSLSALFMRIKRAKFTNTLNRYWDMFLSTWNVLLHGNPVQNVFGSIKVAASGELGMGVGEEERGSGERAVLEGLIGRMDGLVDLIVSKFGDSDPDTYEKNGEKKKDAVDDMHAQWLGATKEPSAEDGAIFLGVGSLSKKSVRDLTYWMEDMYTWGENAYGVVESPKAATRRVKAAPHTDKKAPAAVPTMQVPPSLFEPNRGTKPTTSIPSQQSSQPPGPGTLEGAGTSHTDDNGGGMETYMDYLKLGYGKYWSLGGDSTHKETEPASADGTTSGHPQAETNSSKGNDSVGKFIIGLTGEIEEGWIEDPEERRFAMDYDEENARIMVRTLVVELEAEASEKPEVMFSKVLGSHDTDVSSDGQGPGDRRPSFDSQDSNKAERLRVVVYVVKPFMFTFLFRVRTESLALEGLYRSIHHQIAPLRKSLSRSTAYRLDRPDMGKTAAAIYDLVWDPKAKTVHSTIPNIPEPADIYNSDGQPPWSRVEALNTHMQILNLYKATRLDTNELERTCKTSRGWWIVWSRILERRVEGISASVSSSAGTERPTSQDNNTTSSSSSVSNAAESGEFITASTKSSSAKDIFETDVSKEIFLIRKASDHVGHGRSVSLTSVASGGGWTDGASRLAQGIGVDTRKYIEGLLSLNR